MLRVQPPTDFGVKLQDPQARPYFLLALLRQPCLVLQQVLRNPRKVFADRWGEFDPDHAGDLTSLRALGRATFLPAARSRAYCSISSRGTDKPVRR